MRQARVRIGCGCGFWGDSPEGPVQLVRRGELDFLVLDYLSEITLSLLARARARRPELGYTTDFVTEVMRPLAREIAQRRIRVIANAGGVNPGACRDALEALLRELGVDLKVAVVLGDDIAGELDALREAGVRDLETGGALPERVASASAYLGAFPIAHALDAGADVVITGRCADSALALGPLIHAFGWRSGCDRPAGPGEPRRAHHRVRPAGHGRDSHRLASGGRRLGRHGLPDRRVCGGREFLRHQAAGQRRAGHGRDAWPSRSPMRYTIRPATCCPMSCATSRTCALEDLGGDRVRVRGARGLPADGFLQGESHLPGWLSLHGHRNDRGPGSLREGTRGRRGDTQAHTAPARRARPARTIAPSRWRCSGRRRCMARMRAAPTPARSYSSWRSLTAQERALELFAREIFPAASSMAQGLTGFAGGRPAVQPVVRLFSCLIAKSRVPVTVEMRGTRTAIVAPSAASAGAPPAVPRRQVPVSPPADGPWQEVPLLRLAHGRSGDKGDTANIGILARRPEFRALLDAALTPEAVRTYLAHLVEGDVLRYDWPGLGGWNFVLRRALGGGGIASLRYDPQGKSYAQILMDFPVPVPCAWLAAGGVLENVP